MTQFWNGIEGGNSVNSKKYIYMKKKETVRDTEFDVQEESNFDGDVADLEF